MLITPPPPYRPIVIWETPETTARLDNEALTDFRANPPAFLLVSAKRKATR